MINVSKLNHLRPYLSALKQKKHYKESIKSLFKNQQKSKFKTQEVPKEKEKSKDKGKKLINTFNTKIKNFYVRWNLNNKLSIILFLKYKITGNSAVSTFFQDKETRYL